MSYRQSFERGVLALGFCALGLVAGPRPVAALPEATAVTPALVEAAKKEGKVVFYTAVDIEAAEKVGASFRQKYPGIEIQVERSGSERLFQRIGQEYGSNIANADVVNTSDAAHYLLWKRQGWLAPYVPEDVAKHYGENADPDGLYATWRATLSPIAYNTKYVKPEDAPKSFADLLEPKWRGLIVKAHPGYSGTILTATAQIARELGWDYLSKLGKQRVMQVQSSTEPPKKLAIGERPIMADGNEYNLFTLKESGSPIEIVYPSEGTPFIASPSAVMAKAPHPNAARLLQSFLYTPETQQLLIDAGGLRSLHPATKEPAGRKPLREIKLFKDDAAAVVDKVEEIKANYAKAFGT
jgi:iron(III) transport system substrate-binding protein